MVFLRLSPDHPLWRGSETIMNQTTSPRNVTGARLHARSSPVWDTRPHGEAHLPIRMVGSYAEFRGAGRFEKACAGAFPAHTAPANAKIAGAMAFSGIVGVY